MSEANGKDQEFFRRLTDIILSNLVNENFDVDELVRQSGMSRHTLSRKIFLLKGLKINQFIREVRLKKALELLNNDHITVSEVAYKTGFGSATYFNTCFTEYFGYPPGAVKRGEIDSRPESLSVEDSTVTSKKKALVISRVLISAIVISAIFFLYQKIAAYMSSNGYGTKEKSVAVLPFVNNSPESENSYFINGIRDEILASLQKIKDIRVISPSTWDQLKLSSGLAARDILTKPDADYVVEGSGQKYGNDFRLVVKMTDSRKGKYIWVKSYSAEILDTRDIFRIQSQIAQAVAGELNVKITPSEKHVIDITATQNIKAWDSYQRGMYELARSPYGKYNAFAVKHAEELFRQSAEYDSSMALSYIGIAWCILKKAEITGYPVKSMDSLLALANTALSYDDKLSDGFYTRGIYYSVTGDKEQARKAFERAVNIDPSNWYAFHSLGYCYDDMTKCLEIQMKVASLFHDYQLPAFLREIGNDYFDAGFPEKGNSYFMEALKLDGDSVVHSEMLVLERANTAAEYNGALEYYKKKYLIDSTDASTLMNLGHFYLLMGHDSESLKYFRKYILHAKASGFKISPDVQLNIPFIGYAYMQNGYKKESENYFDSILEENINLIKTSYSKIDNYSLACIYALRGDRTKAFENLKKFNADYAGYSLTWVTKIKNDPFFASLRNDPEFLHIERDIESKYQAGHEKMRKWIEVQK